MKNYRVIAGIIGAGGIALVATAQIITPGQNMTNRPVVFPNTAQPTPLGSTNQTPPTGVGTNLPPAYQNSVSNLNTIIGTNVPNRGYNNPTLTNRPNPNLQMP